MATFVAQIQQQVRLHCIATIYTLWKSLWFMSKHFLRLEIHGNCKHGIPWIIHLYTAVVKTACESFIHRRLWQLLREYTDSQCRWCSQTQTERHTCCSPILSCEQHRDRSLILSHFHHHYRGTPFRLSHCETATAKSHLKGWERRKYTSAVY